MIFVLPMLNNMKEKMGPVLFLGASGPNNSHAASEAMCPGGWAAKQPAVFPSPV